MIKAATGAAAMTVLGIPLMGKGLSGNIGQDKKKILVIGAHPDDPETCAGGTMCLLTAAGHDVVCVYLTRGEAGIAGKSAAEAAAIRVEESAAACRVTGARCTFLDQIDGNTEITLERYKQMREFLEKEKPDVVLTHWPIDGHRDHAVCGLLVMDAWRRVGRSFELYYFEAMSGTQTQIFHPTDWVDITPVADQKHKACLCHKSQDMEELLEGWHYPMEVFRGIECRTSRAEAFIHHITARKDIL